MEPRIGTQPAHLAADAGFGTSTVEPATSILTNLAEADRILGIGRVSKRAVEAGYMDPDQRADWLEDLANRPFLAALTIFLFTLARQLECSIDGKLSRLFI